MYLQGFVTDQCNVAQTSTAPIIPPVGATQCPNTTYTLNAVGGIAGLGSTIEWYTGPNDTGTSLGSGASINVMPTAATATTYYARREGFCNNSVDATVTMNVKDYIYALNGATTTSYCTDDAGWHHFFNGSEIYLVQQ